MQSSRLYSLIYLAYLNIELIELRPRAKVRPTKDQQSFRKCESASKESCQVRLCNELLPLLKRIGEIGRFTSSNVVRKLRNLSRCWRRLHPEASNDAKRGSGTTNSPEEVRVRALRRSDLRAIA